MKEMNGLHAHCVGSVSSKYADRYCKTLRAGRVRAKGRNREVKMERDKLEKEKF